MAGPSREGRVLLRAYGYRVGYTRVTAKKAGRSGQLPENSLLLCLFLYLFKKKFFFLSFLRPHAWHLEVPRIGVQSEL